MTTRLHESANPAMASLPSLSSLAKRLAEAKQVIPVYQSALRDCHTHLANRFRAGDEVGQLITGYSAFIDMILQLAWHRFQWDENEKRWYKTRISLIAIGGYGRGELHPYSDIDLLLLLERNSYQKHAANIQSFLTLLWDIGLEVGHSVRSIQECARQAKRDVTVITALLEARTLCGDAELFAQMTQRTLVNKMWPLKKFYTAKQTEQFERYRKYNHTGHSLEPNVKTSPGGLRDIQTAMWIAIRAYGRLDFDTLVEKNILSAEERDVLRAGQRLLWKIRFGLHLMAGRDDNRLLFESQRKLADMFGYQDGVQLAVERFMQEYYRTAMRVNTISELILQHFKEKVINPSKRNAITPINTYFQIRNKYIEVTSQDIFKQYPPALLEIFLHIGTNLAIEDIQLDTIKLIKQSLYLIDDEFRSNPQVTTHFIGILRTSKRLSSQLTRMARYGILGAYLPEFGCVIGQMQFDLFHIYTVDAHTLQVIRNMRRFRYKTQEQQFPIAAHIYSRLPKIELLYIAGLYHDIAKGMGGDHSKLGIAIASAFCQRHRLSTWDTNIVCWLVEHHLVMSSTAQRKDISDPVVVNEFATLVEHQTRLDYLYALTVADINATNPTLWNSWRASLMNQLYVNTKKALRHGEGRLVDKIDYITDIKQQAMERLLRHGLTQHKITDIWADADQEYFTRESVADIVLHTCEIAKHNPIDGPLILINDITSGQENEGAAQIFIHATHQDYTFAAIVSAIDLLDLQVVDARITGQESKVFDTYVVLEANSAPVGLLRTCQDKIRQLIAEHLDRTTKVEPKLNQRTPRLLKPFAFKTEVDTSFDDVNQLTVLEIITPDRPGLLVIIANLFAELGVTLHSAKITTLGERVEDVFYVTNSQNNPLQDVSELKQRLCEALDNHIQQVA